MSADIIRFPVERCRPSNEGALVCEDITPEEIQLMRDAVTMLVEQDMREYQRRLEALYDASKD